MDMEYLKYLYKSKGVTVSDLIEVLEISASCLYSRLRCGTDWNVGEIRKIRAFLDLTDDQVKRVFGI